MTRKKILVTFKRSDARAWPLVLDLEAVVRWWGDGIRRKMVFVGLVGRIFLKKKNFCVLLTRYLKIRWYKDGTRQ